MKVTLALCLAAIAIYAVSAEDTPCADICRGNCGLANMACTFTGFFGPLCQVENQLCGQVCAAVCGCLDGCANSCLSTQQTCLTNANNDPLAVAQCQLTFGFCEFQCNTNCAANNFAQAIQMMSGAGAGSS